jgi:hypothetical protein
MPRWVEMALAVFFKAASKKKDINM